MKLPLVSIVMPVLNAEEFLPACLASIDAQDYPKECVELIAADGGSTDHTRELLKQFGAVVVDNPHKTSESGKAAGVTVARGDFIALIDSDNVLPYTHWLTDMLEPLLEQPDAVGSEPWEYTWRKEDRFITRYCALIGMNDPYVSFMGNYDRRNTLTGKWTEVPHAEKDFGNYLIAILDKRGVPTIGANGAVFRAAFLKNSWEGDYLFDIDVIAKEVYNAGSVKILKVKNGIVHTYCEGDIAKFARKQRRRVMDYLFHKSVGGRLFRWETATSKKGQLKFVLYCVTLLPLLLQALRGYLKKPDLAWFFHPLACEITLFEYGMGHIKSIFKRSELSRVGWRQ